MKGPSTVELIRASVFELHNRIGGYLNRDFAHLCAKLSVFVWAILFLVYWLLEVKIAGSVGGAVFVLYGWHRLATGHWKKRILELRKTRKSPHSLKLISNFADFWGLGLRKRIKACAGEFDVEVKRLHKEKRYRMAKWNVVLAWGYAIWYVLRGPYDLVKDALVKAMKGS